MVAAAKARRLDVRLMDAAELKFSEAFDAAFSNATLHWVLDKERGMSSLLRKVTDPQKAGNESLDGVQTQHFKGSVPAASFGAMTGGQVTATSVPGDLWVGNDDFLPRQVRLEGPIGAGDTTATVRVLKFSQYNAAVTIDRPI